MIYIETITDDMDTFRIERQKNSPDGEWYGISLDSDGKNISDNDEWMLNSLLPMLKTYPKKAMDELGLPHNSGNAKIIHKLIKKAVKLGWFNEVATYGSVVKF